MTLPSEVFRARLRLVRRLKGWTQQQLSAELARADVELSESAIVRMEKGTRGVSLNEAIAIAAVLGVSPLHMTVPLDNDQDVDVAPAITVPVLDARAWARGQTPLRAGDDDRFFYAQTPERDWDAIAPRVAERFASREDFEERRARWEREVLMQFVRDTGGKYSEAPAPAMQETADEDRPVRRVISLSDASRTRVEPQEEDEE
jgi:transcriptional regulator with XRE-family HTH domain